MKKQFQKFLKIYEERVVPLTKEVALANFNAAISGKKEDYEKSAELQIKLSKIYSNKNDFELLKKIKESNSINEKLLKRELDLIYDSFLAYQIDETKLEQMIRLQTEIENKFSTYRTMVGGKTLTDNQVDEILKTSLNNEELKKTWMASKEIGQMVSEDVIKLVKLRNESAISLGFNNFHEMSLLLNEQNPKEIDSLFDELDNLTKDNFNNAKEEIDSFLSEKFNIPNADLMAWHYQDRFFQEPPKIYKVNFDKFYEEKNLVEITQNYFSNIGLSIDDIISNSDLFEKEGKYQHAFCTDIDKNGDVRVVCNLKSNYRWMGTMLHEYGHAVYDKFKDKSLAWQLREPAHIFTTEAIAMMFGRLASNPKWLQDEIGIGKDKAEEIKDNAFNSLRLEQLTFCRWVQVMYRFEKAMYENPEQNLNNLWWQLVEKYQLIKKPIERNEPDWASKIHIALYPAYYHNYMLGELLASQIYNFIKVNILNKKVDEQDSFSNNNEIGKYLIENIFLKAKKFHWNEMIEQATGEKLTPKYYAMQFVK